MNTVASSSTASVSDTNPFAYIYTWVDKGEGERVINFRNHAKAIIKPLDFAQRHRHTQGLSQVASRSQKSRDATRRRKEQHKKLRNSCVIKISGVRGRLSQMLIGVIIDRFPSWLPRVLSICLSYSGQMTFAYTET